MSRIRKLDTDLGNLVRAPSILPSFHNIVEELIMNSLDAGASRISIRVDIEQYSVRCCDDGHGIYQYDMVTRGLLGQWHVSSKQNSGSFSFGFRGEALAAIKSVSELTLISKTRGGRTVKQAFGNPQTVSFDENELDLLSGFACGTVCIAEKIFEQLPVRRRIMRANTEIARIREFIHKMAILHHKIGWTLDIANNRKSLLSLYPDSSVASRIAEIADPSILTKMVQVSIHCHGMHLVGLMSPPLLSCCHCTRDYQYFYLGKRWMRGIDYVSKMLNREFLAILDRVNGKVKSGPFPKHATLTGAHAPAYPCFVLQLLCSDPSAEYDLFSEPDKTTACFREPGHVQDLVRKLLDYMLRSECKTGTDIAGNIDDILAVNAYTVHGHSSEYLSDIRMDNLFCTAFLSSTPDRAMAYTTQDVYDKGNDSKSAVSLRNAPNVRLSPDQCHEAGLAHSDGISHSPSEHFPHIDMYASRKLGRNCAFESAFFGSTVPKRKHSGGQFNEPAICASDSLMLSTPVRNADERLLDIWSSNALHAVNISKAELLSDCELVGQADKKYLIIRVGSLLVAADQHAVDERVRLETLTFERKLYSNAFQHISPLSMSLNEQSLAILRERKSLLQSLGFLYHTDSDTSKVVLSGVPIVDGEVLNANDFEEFIYALASKTFSLPDSLCRPPAVARILASHACRNAVKFGDLLTNDYCRELVKRISCAQFPFICAHGRVSMAPLVDLRSLKRPVANLEGSKFFVPSKRKKPVYSSLYK